MDDAVDHYFLAVNGAVLHVTEAGSGPPLLMLHDCPGSGAMWRDLVPWLAQSRRVICPDFRGFGLSGGARGGKEQLAQDVVGLMDELELDRVGIVGQGWGGWIGLLTCLREAERVDRLLAINLAGGSLDPQRLMQDLKPLLRGGTLTTPTYLLFGLADFALSQRLVYGVERHAANLQIEVIAGEVREEPEAVTHHAMRFLQP